MMSEPELQDPLGRPEDLVGGLQDLSLLPPKPGARPQRPRGPRGVSKRRRSRRPRNHQWEKAVVILGEKPMDIAVKI